MNVGSFDPITVALFLAGLSLLPIVAVTTTAFLKTAIVLLMVRNAMGVQQVPPTLALYGIALAVTAYTMAPTFSQMGDAVLANPINSTSTAQNLSRIRTVAEPLRTFMIRHAQPDQVDWFVDAANRMRPAKAGEQARRDDWSILVPSFVVSQLQSAYQIAIAIYIPFIVIEILVSCLLLALGMQMVSPTVLSIPLKLLLFVAVDGWTRLLHGLSLSFG